MKRILFAFAAVAALLCTSDASLGLQTVDGVAMVSSDATPPAPTISIDPVLLVMMKVDVFKQIEIRPPLDDPRESAIAGRGGELFRRRLHEAIYLKLDSLRATPPLLYGLDLVPLG